ncbi:MAG: hypothetical protein OXF02_04665, partial [Simkaniaceae bacterium]|nr:hypothetical protein [Simkaniaceae bacterium]
VDAPVRFPKKETEVARKAEKWSREVLDRGKCASPSALDRRVDNISLGFVAGACVLAPVGIATAGTFGAIYGGATGLALGVSLPFSLGVGVILGACFCSFCATRGSREYSKESLTKNCGCIERCRVKRSREKTKADLEEVVTEQPKSESPSSEPEPAERGWFGFSGWFAEPSEETARR